MKNQILISMLILFSFNIQAQDYWIEKSFTDSVSINNIAINSVNEIFVTATYYDPDIQWWIGLVYYSNDDGNTWIIKTPYYNFHEIIDVLIDSEDNIYLGTWTGGIYKSVDSGNTWEEKNSGLTNICPTSLAINSEGWLYAGHFWGGGIDYSENGGDEWIQINYPLYGCGVRGLGIGLNDYIFVDASNYSVDNGNTWSTIDEGLSVSVLINQVWYSFNTNNEVFLGTVEGIYYLYSCDSTWEKILSTDGYVYDIIINSENKIYAGSSDGVFYSENNGQDWQLINEQFSSFPPGKFSFDSDGYLWAVGSNVIYKSKYIINKKFRECKNLPKSTF